MKEIYILVLIGLIASQNIYSSNSRLNDTIINTDTLISDLSKDDLIISSDSLSLDSLILSIQDSITVTRDSLIPHKDTITLILAGDVMLGTNYPSEKYLPPGKNCSTLLEPVKQYLQEADLAFCNMEGVFAGNEGAAKSCKNPENCYVFRMPDEYLDCFIEAGFDLVSVANNHVNDFGYGGRQHAASLLQQSGLQFAGFVEHPYAIFHFDSLRIGFCAFSPNSGVMDMRDMKQSEELVRFLADSCDLVLVSMHGGGEGSGYQHVTRKPEEFLGAARGNVYDFAHRMIDAGADVIIGHGPHVTRAMEIYKNRFIAYSLGNFCTYSRFNLNGPNGIAPLVKICIDRQGKLINGKIIPIKQIGEGGAQIDPDNKVIIKLQELNRLDFQDNLLIIDNSGNFINENSIKSSD